MGAPRTKNSKLKSPLKSQIKTAGGAATRKSKISDRLRKIRHVALDMDGTIYLNKTVFDTHRAVSRFTGAAGNRLILFLTNNPSKSTAEYLAHLNGMGIQATADQLYTSTQATIDFLKARFPRGPPPFCPRAHLVFAMN